MNYLDTLVSAASMRLALAGDGAGNVAIAGRDDFIYARLGGAGVDVIEVRASAIQPDEGDSIYVLLENPARLGGTWRMVFWLRAA